MKNANIYGYMRVSSREQNEDRQRIALLRWGFRRGIFIWINSPVKILRGHSIRNY